MKNGFELSTWVWLKVSTVPLGSGDVSLSVLGVAGGVGVLGCDPVPPHAVNTDTNNPATANKTWCRFIAYMALWFRRRPGNGRSAARPKILICLEVDNTGGSSDYHIQIENQGEMAVIYRVEVATAYILKGSIGFGRKIAELGEERPATLRTLNATHVLPSQPRDRRP